MKKLTITKKDDDYDAVIFCIKAVEKLGRRKWEQDKKTGTELLHVTEEGRLIATDRHRAHLVRVDLPSGLYNYSKVKSTITLEPTKEKSYPDIFRVIPKRSAHRIKVNREDLLRRCKQAKVIADNNFSALVLSFNGRLDLKIVNPDIGYMTAHVKIDKPIKPKIKVGININYLIDALTGLKGDKITISLQRTEKSALIFKRRGDQIATIMPMRV